MKNTQWGEFKIGHLFEIKSYIKRFDANKVTVLKQGKYPYVVRMSSNNGQKGFIDEDVEFLNEGNTISFGQDTATMYYQDIPYFTGDKIKILKARDNKFSERNAQFLIATMRRSFASFSWGSSSFSVDKIKNQPITLPVKQGKIDYDLMEQIISEIEIDRITQLKEHLQNTNLINYSLTKNEKDALATLKSDGITYKEFKIETLFEVAPSKAYTKNDGEIIDENGITPYVSNQSQNNGHIGKSNLKPLNPSNVITLSDTWQSHRTIYYQPKEFIGKSHLQVMKPKNQKFEKLDLFFIISSFRKAILEMKYDYGTKFNRDRINATKIQLPVIDNNIDIELIRNLMSAINKTVAKGVVKYVIKRTVNKN